MVRNKGSHANVILEWKRIRGLRNLYQCVCASAEMGRKGTHVTLKWQDSQELYTPKKTQACKLSPSFIFSYGVLTSVTWQLLQG